MFQKGIDAGNGPGISAAELGLNDEPVAICRNVRCQPTGLRFGEVRLNILFGRGLEFD